MTDTTTTDTPVPLLRQARDAMPGRAAIVAALDAVDPRIRRVRASGRPEFDEAIGHALSRVLAGEPTPDDLGARVIDVRRANEAALAELQALDGLAQRLRERLRDTNVEQVDPALAVLAAVLDALLDEARPVLAALGDVPDPGAAIERGVVEPWREATRLAERYAELRQAQGVVTSAAISPPDSVSAGLTDRISPDTRWLVGDYGHVKDAARHGTVGSAAANRADQYTSGTRVVGGRVVQTTRTEKPARSRPWLTDDGLADLRFILGDGVEPWVPTVRELTAARDEHAQRLRDEARAAAEPPRRAERAQPSRPPLSVFPRGGH